MSAVTPARIAEARKALVAGLELVGQILNAGLVHGTAAHVLAVVLAAAGALGVFTVPNGSRSTSTASSPTPPPAVAVQSVTTAAPVAPVDPAPPVAPVPPPVVDATPPSDAPPTPPAAA